MKIKKITYIDHVSGWNVKNLCFDSLTLLVGASGVGKTQILKSISNIAEIARGASFNGVEWTMVFVADDNEYVWTGKFSSVSVDNIDGLSVNDSQYDVSEESICCSGKLIVERNESTIKLDDKEIVKLDTKKSVIELLKEEQLIAPIYKAFSQLYQLRKDSPFSIGLNFMKLVDKNNLVNVTSIHDAHMFSPINKLFLLYSNRLEEFNQIKSDFCNIFKLVEDIDFKTELFFDNTPYPVLRIKEKGVDSWIVHRNISSGMIRTLSQLTILNIAQDGDVIMVDEFENGLGVNCIDSLANQIIYPEKDIQVIVTSHHPYIINAIPFKRWKIVTRNQSEVTVQSTDDLNIGNHSKHDAFIQLIQTQEFKTGQR